MTLTCGVDIGSTTIKVALMRDGSLTRSRVVKTGAHPSANASRALHEVLALDGISRHDVASIMSTGYGRNYFNEADATASEIVCHAHGVRHFIPSCRTVIDIGGQDSKIISMGEGGRVTDFKMNDRCAAGTGKFLEMVASMLDMDVAEMGAVGEGEGDVCEISSICAVFAESEVIGLTQSGTPLDVLLRGVFRSVARRVLSLGGRAGMTPDVVFSGGVALSRGVHRAIECELGGALHGCEQPQITGAVGAALLGWERLGRGKGDIRETLPARRR